MCTEGSHSSIFAENDLLKSLARFLNSGNDAVDISILETLSLIVQNITQLEDICKMGREVDYVMSHNAVHSVISASYNFCNDELATVYVAFLKGIVIRLNHETIHFFFNEVGFIVKCRDSAISLCTREL